MEWFTYIVYGLAPIVLFYGVGIIIVSMVLKLLIDSWVNHRRKLSSAKELELMYEEAAKARRF